MHLLQRVCVKNRLIYFKSGVIVPAGKRKKKSRLGSLLFLYIVSQFQWFKVSFR